MGGRGAPHGGMRAIGEMKTRLAPLESGGASLQGAASPDASASGELRLSQAGGLTPGYWSLTTPPPRAEPALLPPSSLLTSATSLLASAAGQSSPNGSPIADPRTDVGEASDQVADDQGEWRTGDVFEVLEGGWLRHVCRADELLLHSSGEMTNPTAVEAAVLIGLQVNQPASRSAS